MPGFLAAVSAIWWFVSWPFRELFRERDWIDIPLYEDDVDESSLECADASAIRSLARALAWCLAGLSTPFPTNPTPHLELYDEVDKFTLERADVAAVRAFTRALSWGLLALFALPSISASGPLPSSMAASTQTTPPVLAFTGIIPSSVISISPSVPARHPRTGPLPSIAEKLSITGPIQSSIVSISPTAPSKPVYAGQVPSSTAPTVSTTHRPTTIPGPVPSLMVPKSSTIPRPSTSSGPAPSSMGSINEVAAAPSRNYKRGFQFRFANPPPPARPNIPVAPPPSAPTFQFGSNVSPLPTVPPPSRLNSAGFSFGMGFMADAAETSRALYERAAGPVPALSVEEKGKKPEEIVKVEKEPELEKQPELEKEEETGVEEELGGNGPRESRQAKRAREKREKREKKKEEKGTTPPKGPSVREVLEGGA